MSTNKPKKLDLDFSLDGDVSTKKDSVDFLLKDKTNQDVASKAAIDFAKAQIVSNSAQDNIVTVSHETIGSISTLLKRRPKKDMRLQTYITSELLFAIQNWKRIVQIDKDIDAIEALLRIALGLKQI